MSGPKLAATVARGTRALIAVAFAAGCAGDLALGEEGYWHRRHGYTVGVPNAGVSVATDGCGARIINLNTGVEKKLVTDNAYYGNSDAVITISDFKSRTNR